MSNRETIKNGLLMTFKEKGNRQDLHIWALLEIAEELEKIRNGIDLADIESQLSRLIKIVASK